MASDCALAAVYIVCRGSKESTILKPGCSHYQPPHLGQHEALPNTRRSCPPHPAPDQVAPPNTKRP